MESENNLSSENIKQIVISGNNIETLKNYPDNYFDAVVTDPPYGLGKEPNAEEMLRAWIDTGYLEVSGSGFMGKEWDAFVPQPLFWKEIFRVLKYGGHIVSFFGTRTYEWGCMAIRLAGFEIRDCIQWVYGSGFPKSHNISKAIDKMHGSEREIIGQGKAGKGFNKVKGFGDNTSKSDDFTSEWDVTKASTEEAKEWEGWGSALKPANEPIVLARKPLEKGLSIAENVLKWGTGAINIDGCRVGNEKRTIPVFSDDKKTDETSFNLNSNIQHHREETTQGRFPANFIMTHHPDCKCQFFKYEGEEEINEEWTCVEDCPIKILDEQSGTLNEQGISKSDNKSGWQNNYVGGNGVNAVQRKLYLDKGGASRFFYIAKANKWERNFGLDGFEEKQTTGGGGGIGNYLEDINSASGKYGSEKAPNKNIHPTVKPIKLMQYLVRMITPPNGIVLDPFAGSGTTGIACKIDGFNFVGLELSEDYTKIANARIESFQEENVFIDETIIYKNRNKEGDENEEEDDINNSTQLSLF
jgi:site-specific DNA-methyltransferase (adenine-specific)